MAGYKRHRYTGMWDARRPCDVAQINYLRSTLMQVFNKPFRHLEGFGKGEGHNSLPDPPGFGNTD